MRTPLFLQTAVQPNEFSIGEHVFEYITRRADTPKFSSPPRAGHIELPAEGAPHVARIHTRFDRLGTRMSVETGNDVIDENGVPPHLSELVHEQFTEFSQAHYPTVPRHTSTGSSTSPEPAAAADAARVYAGSFSTRRTASPIDSGLGGRTTTALPCRAARLANSH